MSTKKQQTSDGYMMTKKAYTTTKKIKPMKKETMPKTKDYSKLDSRGNAVPDFTKGVTVEQKDYMKERPTVNKGKSY